MCCKQCYKQCYIASYKQCYKLSLQGLKYTYKFDSTHQQNAFWAMNERERTDVLKCLYAVQLHVRPCKYSQSCVKRIDSGPLATHQVSAQSVQPSPRYGKGVRTCTCTPTINFCKTPSEWVSNHKQVSTQSIQLFPRYEKGGARATVPRP